MIAPRAPRALLVDLDDTIINFGGNVKEAWRTVCREAAIAMPGLNAEALLASIDRIRGWYWSDPERHRQGRANLRAASRHIVEQAMGALGHDPSRGGALADRYRDLRDEAMHLFPGAIDVLAKFRSLGVRMGLVTNGSTQDQRNKIERFDLVGYFDHILIEGEFGCGKPDPRVYVAALAGLESTAEETWFVGDNLEWDVAAPQRLGMYAVWVDAARTGLPTGTTVRPDRIIRARRACEVMRPDQLSPSCYALLRDD